MKKDKWYRFIVDEWLFVVSALGVLSTSAYLRRIPTYDFSDFKTLYALLVLFVITNGLYKHHVLAEIASKIDNGRFLPVKLLLITFFFSMIVTNDVAVLAIVPLTLTLHIPFKEWVVILEALAANAGSALSPFGNPQNIFLYWHYGIPFGQFLKVIMPFSLSFLVVLLLIAFIISRHTNSSHPLPQKAVEFTPLAYFYLVSLGVFILAMAQILPLWLGVVILSGVFIVERGKVSADYLLLATFALFFGFTDNLKVILSAVLAHPHHVFLLSSLLSQMISNVPTALLVADFTERWEALLWGVSVGGFGNLIGSLASLIAYRLYQKSEDSAGRNLLGKFHAVSYGAFFMGWLIYFIFHKIAG